MEIEALYSMKEVESSRQAGMGVMDGAGTHGGLGSPWYHPAVSGLRSKLAELTVTIIQVPPDCIDRFCAHCGACRLEANPASFSACGWGWFLWQVLGDLVAVAQRGDYSPEPLGLV